MVARQCRHNQVKGSCFWHSCEWCLHEKLSTETPDAGLLASSRGLVGVSGLGCDYSACVSQAAEAEGAEASG